MKSNLFVYGTLCREDVYAEVTGDSYPDSSSATLPGYALGKPIHGYPAIWPTQNGSIEGRLLEHVTEKALTKLDEYEGEEYDRTRVSVQVDGNPVEAFTYVGKS